MIKEYLEYISKEIDSHSSKHDDFLVLADSNSEPTEEAMKRFCQIYNLRLIRQSHMLQKPHQFLVCWFDHSK